MKERFTWITIITVCWIIGTIGMVITLKSSELLEIIRLFFLSIGAYGVVSATFLNMWNALEASKNVLDRTNFDKQENSFKYLERWDTSSLKEARDFTRSIRKERPTLSDEQLKDKIRNDENLERSIITTFNYWEEIYFSIKYDRVNEEILKKSFSSLYCNMYDRFKVWIDDEKEKVKDNEGLKALQELYRRWKG